jgi:6-phosphogluconolactonase
MHMQFDHTVSRRQFIAVSAIGAFGLMRRTVSLADSPWLYAGTYTENGRIEGLHLLRFDATTGAVSLASSFDVGPNPSFLTIHPNRGSLYLVNEVDDIDGDVTGSVRSFTINETTGDITAVSARISAGASPCYISTDRTGRVAMVANYAAGTVATLGIGADASLTAPLHVVQHVGTGTIASRQEHAHAHCIIAHSSNRFAVAADLGADRVLVYRLDVSEGGLTHIERSDAVMPPGTGPRHLVFHPTLPICYVTGELNSTVSAMRCNLNTGALQIAQTLPTLPAGTAGENFPADVHVAPDGRTLYVSNRGHNSISVFRIAAGTGLLSLEQTVPTGGNWPRNFTLDPSGHWLLVANQRSGSVTVFRRDMASGRLTPTTKTLELAAPVCLRFLSGDGTR